MKDHLDELHRFIMNAEYDIVPSEMTVTVAKKALADVSECLDEMRAALLGLLALTGDEAMDTADSTWAAAIEALEHASGEGFDFQESKTMARRILMCGDQPWEMT